MINAKENNSVDFPDSEIFIMLNNIMKYGSSTLHSQIFRETDLSFSGYEIEGRVLQATLQAASSRVS